MKRATSKRPRGPRGRPVAYGVEITRITEPNEKGLRDVTLIVRDKRGRESVWSLVAKHDGSENSTPRNADYDVLHRHALTLKGRLGVLLMQACRQQDLPFGKVG